MRGFTLIEVVLALVIFQVGMLALAATIAVSAGDIAAANRRMRAQSVARARIASLRASACPVAASGRGELAGGLVEHWSVTAEGRLRRVADSVSITLPRGRSSAVVLAEWMRCG